MVIFSERAGLEFDWFAVDEVGQIAVFATAGNGPVPAEVPVEASLHDAVGDQIEVSGWGTSEVWDSYAKLGLFAYDWDQQRNCYSRVAQPSQAATEGSPVQLASAKFPRLALSFRSNPTIAVDVV